jgi:hypothetical protein
LLHCRKWLPVVPLLERIRKCSDVLHVAVAVGPTDGWPVTRSVREGLGKNRVAYVCSEASTVYVNMSRNRQRECEGSL